MGEPSHRAHGDSAEPGPGAGEDDDSLSEATVVVDRGESDRTVVVDRGNAESDRTVVVDRGNADSERTVVVDRGDSDRTVVVDRDDNERTVVVDRDEGERTVVVERAVKRKPADGDATVVVGKRAKPKTPSNRGPRGRQRINLPPVEAGFAEKAVLASGPGAVENYAPRELPVQPEATPRLEQSAVITRPPADAVPSVRKSSRRFGVIAVVGFALACVVSVVGLVAIGFAVLRSF